MSVMLTKFELKSNRVKGSRIPLPSLCLPPPSPTRAATPSGEVILDALSATYYPILRNYILEIVVLFGAGSRMTGLTEVCATPPPPPPPPPPP
ncbi:hypothetical protein DFH09DRAFT_140962 [Mycena vulgaris]|nr:hypothetical protein DFH09DRAFT_140962 [Mycena vulgaris]